MKRKIGYVVNGWVDSKQTVLNSPGQSRERMIVCGMKRTENRLDALKRKLFDLLIVENIDLIIPTGYEVVFDGVGE
jgi:hypothetical protein